MIREKRIEAGLSQPELSELSGVPVRTIQNWEGGTCEPKVLALKRVADVLGCKVDDLIPDQAARPSASGRP